MSEATAQPRAWSRDEWAAAWEVEAKALGIWPESPFEDPQDDLADVNCRAHIRTLAIDARDAIHPARAKQYLDGMRKWAAEGRSLPQGVVNSFLALGETPPELRSPKETSQ